MKKRERSSLEAAYLDELIEEITVDANGEDEQLWAFRQAFEDDVPVPCDAIVIGEPVKVIKFDYDRNGRRRKSRTPRSPRHGCGQASAIAAGDPESAPADRLRRYLPTVRGETLIPSFAPRSSETLSACHPSDQFPEILQQAWASGRLRVPAPEEAESFALPTNERIWPRNREG